MEDFAIGTEVGEIPPLVFYSYETAFSDFVRPKVKILGRGISLMNYNRRATEDNTAIWTCGNTAMFNMDLHENCTFLMDAPNILWKHRDSSEVNFFNSIYEKPLIMPVAEGDFGREVVSYPIGMVMKFANDRGAKFLARYFTCSAAFAVALCCAFEDVKEIECHGLDYLDNNEQRQHQRASVEAWLGFAAGIGKKVKINSASMLMNSVKFAFRDICAPFGDPIYGYDPQPDFVSAGWESYEKNGV